MASSVNAGLLKRSKDLDITWIVANDDAKLIFLFSKQVKVFTIDEFLQRRIFEFYDVLINLSCNATILNKITAKEKIGFGYEPQSEKYRDCICGDSSIDMNLFQVYYRLAGLSWRGEGYDISYYPRTKVKKSRIGLAIANANLRNFIKENLDLEMSKLWVIPYKKNIFKRMDEINRCKTIVTDDYLTMHFALYLRKSVNFLQTLPYNFKVELFNSGKVYKVPVVYFR